MRLGSKPHTWCRKAFTVSVVGEGAVKSFGFAGGSGSAEATGAGGFGLKAGAAAGAWAEGAWGAGAAGVAAGACANASEAASGNRSTAIKTVGETELGFFNEFLLVRE